MGASFPIHTRGQTKLVSDCDFTIHTAKQVSYVIPSDKIQGNCTRGLAAK